MRKEVLHKCHDSKWADHPGIHHTMAPIEDQYYRPHLHNDIKTYVKTYLVCQQGKLKQQSLTGLLEPLLILKHPWESVIVDFIVNLLKSRGCQTFMIMVDRFSKYATFVLAIKDCPTEEVARLFLKHVFKY